MLTGKHQHMEVKSKGGPSGGLVLRDGRHNGNELLGVGWVQQRQESDVKVRGCVRDCKSK